MTAGFPVLLVPNSLLILASGHGPGGDEAGDGMAAHVTAKLVA